MFLVCFGFLSRSLEAAVLGKFWLRSKSFGSLDLSLSSSTFGIGDPKTNGICTLCKGTKIVDSWPMSVSKHIKTSIFKY